MDEAFGRQRGNFQHSRRELRRARREELTQTQLQNKNPSKKIVDKDNHLRDCLKYLVLTLPDPAQKTVQQRIQEAVRPHIEAHDLTSAAAQAARIKAEAEHQAKPMRFRRRW
jgi:carbamoylphosphate synthase large subunit